MDGIKIAISLEDLNTLGVSDQSLVVINAVITIISHYNMYAYGAKGVSIE